jgi:hypothetical protein
MKVETRSSAWSCALALALAVACSKESPPTAEQPKSPIGAAAQPEVAAALPAPPAAEPAAGLKPAVAAEPAAAEPAAAGASQVTDTSFELKIAPKGAYEAGKPAEAEIVLDAKPPFHVNDKYPYKFKLKEAKGLTFPAPLVGKDAVKLEKARATMSVAFTPQTAGKHELGGQFSFSVCTDDKCLIEKRDLSLLVDAK